MTSQPVASPPPTGEPNRTPNASELAEAARAARRVLRATDRAALATRARAMDGWPFPSLVLVALDHDATPLLRLSGLAEHAANIAADPRVGLLFDGTAGLDTPLAGPRVSVLGRAVAVERDMAKARFQARHPSSSRFMGFSDFATYRVEMTRVHVVQGFGRAYWLDGEAVRLGSAASAWGGSEGELIARLNEVHAAELATLARHLGWEGEGWTITGIDAEGCDARLGANPRRIEFDRLAEDGPAALDLFLRIAAKAANQPPS